MTDDTPNEMTVELPPALPELLAQLQLFAIETPIDGYVYAMAMPSGAIKLGWTGRSPRRRARELGAEVLAFSYGSLADESALHERLAAYRIGRTEDFWPEPDVWRTVLAMQLEPPVP